MTDLVFFQKQASFYTNPSELTYYSNNYNTDTNFYSLLNVNGSNSVMKCMLFDAASEDGYSVTINSIDVCGFGYSLLQNPGDIIIRIYELPGRIDEVTGISVEDLSINNLKAKYASTTYSNPIQANDVFFTLCTLVDGYDPFIFNPGTSRNTYFIASIQLHSSVGGDVFFFKSNDSIDYFRNSGTPIIIDSYTAINVNVNTNDYFTLENSDSDVVVSKNTGTSNYMGWFALGMWGSITQNNPVCFHGNSLVHTNNGIKYAKCITEEDNLTDGTNFYSISKVLKSSNCTNLVHISKHSINKDQPYSDFYVTRTHMIKVNDEEYQAQELVDKYEGLKIIELTNPCHVYSFITEKGDYVKINGLNVKTFNSGEFINY